MPKQSDQIQLYSYASPKHPPTPYRDVSNLAFGLNWHLNHRLWLTFLFSFTFILACILGALTLKLSSVMNSAPSDVGLQQAIDGYFHALEEKDYQTAKSYFSPAVDDKSQKVSSNLFRQLDSQKGRILSYTIIDMSTTNSGDTASATVNVRQDLNQTYDVHLYLVLVGQAWKINSMDTV